MNFISVLLCISLLSAATYLLLFPNRSFFNDISKKQWIYNDNDENDNIVVHGSHDFTITAKQCSHYVETANAIHDDKEWENSIYKNWKKGTIFKCQRETQGGVGNCCFCYGSYATGGGMLREEIYHTCCEDSHCEMDEAQCREYSEHKYHDRDHCEWCKWSTYAGKCSCEGRDGISRDVGGFNGIPVSDGTVSWTCS